MYFVIEGDPIAVQKVEKRIKELVDKTDFVIDASFENRKEDYSKLLRQTQEKGDGIIINHCIVKFIRDSKSNLSKPEIDYEFYLAETCLRSSKHNGLFIIAVEDQDSPFSIRSRRLSR